MWNPRRFTADDVAEIMGTRRRVPLEEVATYVGLPLETITKRAYERELSPHVDPLRSGKLAITKVGLMRMLDDLSALAPGRDPLPIRRVVYFIHEAGSGLIKIGYTERLGARLTQLRTPTPHRLTVLLTIPGAREMEGAMHRRFAALRERGEWFRAGAELLSFIEHHHLTRAA